MSFRMLFVSFLVTCLASTTTTAFVVVHDSAQKQRRVPQFHHYLRVQRRTDETEQQFFERLTQAASDPQTFESMAMGEEEQPQEKPPIMGRYVPVEEWDAAQRNITQGMSWEERVQFDGQMNGNRFRQNEILRQNLNRF